MIEFAAFLFIVIVLGAFALFLLGLWASRPYTPRVYGPPPGIRDALFWGGFAVFLIVLCVVLSSIRDLV
jgi:hypothetical protein